MHFLNVYLQVALVVESHVAERAVKEHLSRVHGGNVSRHVSFTRESLSTELTRVRIHSAVHSYVDFQSRFVDETLLAQMTRKLFIVRFVCLVHMFSQGGIAVERFATFVAVIVLTDITEIRSLRFFGSF